LREPFSVLPARSSVEAGSTSFRSVDATACDFGTKEKNHVIPKRGNSSKVVSAPPPDGPVGCHHAVGVTGPQTFNIISLNSNGSGTAGLTCGTGCGWTFAIQVAPDRSSFNMVDVTDPGNFLEGTAIHQ
jgi:hypothetical protein